MLESILFLAFSSPIHPNDLYKREKKELKAWKSEYKSSACTNIVQDYYDQCIDDDGHFVITNFTDGRSKFNCIDNQKQNLGQLYENYKLVPETLDVYNDLNFTKLCSSQGLVIHHNFFN